VEGYSRPCFIFASFYLARDATLHSEKGEDDFHPLMLCSSLGQ
jgi:hypothetical protein